MSGAGRQQPHIPSPITHARPHVLYEVYCLLCGRGLGRAGVLMVSMTVPQERLEPCRSCGGLLLVREVVTNRDRDLVALPSSFAAAMA